jgi:hypothetical protein
MVYNTRICLDGDAGSVGGRKGGRNLSPSSPLPLCTRGDYAGAIFTSACSFSFQLAASACIPATSIPASLTQHPADADPPTSEGTGPPLVALHAMRLHAFILHRDSIGMAAWQHGSMACLRPFGSALMSFMRRRNGCGATIVLRWVQDEVSQSGRKQAFAPAGVRV